MRCLTKLLVSASAVFALASADPTSDHHRHHHRHHHHHPGAVVKGATVHGGANKSASKVTRAAPVVTMHSDVQVPKAAVQMASDQQILQKMKRLEADLSQKEHASTKSTLKKQGHLVVNAPLPDDFSSLFTAGVAEATGCRASEVTLLGAAPKADAKNVDEVVFEARPDVIKAVEQQASDPDSELSNGRLHSFLVAKSDDDEDDEDEDKDKSGEHAPASGSPASGPEVDMSMPYGDLAPFGREDTAKELTEESIRESDAMVDQLERAEVAEEKRAVFRALTRLRGAAITSYDGIARSQTGNIDEYARKNRWLKAHPVRHLAEEEGDVQRWAFPESSD